MKACTKCGIVKDYTQFSKNRAAKDGHQFHCKECNNKDNYRFRHEIDPTYMNRWFNSHRKQWNAYNNHYAGSGDTNKIYTITSPEGMIYVGFTRRKKIVFRWLEHRKFYKTNRFKLPLLWASFDKYGVENHTFELRHEFKGTKREGLDMESKLIQFYKSIDKSLNVND